MTVYGVATPGTVPRWSIAIPQAGGPMRLTAGGSTHNVNEVTLRVTTSPSIPNQRLSVTGTLLDPPGDQQWQMIFGGTFINGFDNQRTDGNGVLTLILGRQQLFSAVWMPPGGPNPGYPEGRMDFKIQAGSVVEFEIDLVRA